MRILFIAAQAIRSNSSVTMMNLAFINGLIELGHEVEVITAKLPNEHVAIDTGFKVPIGIKLDEYPLSNTFNILSSKQKKRELRYTVVSAIKGLIRKSFYKYSIYDSQKSWIKNVENIKSNKEVYDLVISSSDPKHSHLFAEKLLKSKKVSCGKWLQLWGDPMYLDITRQDVIFRRRLHKEEERLISKANNVIYVSPFTATEQRKIFPKYAEKIDYVLIPYFKKDESLPNQTHGENLVFGYYGDYNTEIRNLKPLYDAAVESKLRLLIRGNSDKPFKSKALIDVKSRVAIDELEEVEKKTDVFIHLCNSKGTQIPAKVYYYSGTKKPILFILDGETEKIKIFFEKFDRYFFCENKKEDIQNAINRIRFSEYGSNVTRIVEELSPAAIAADLLKKIRV
ncbi:glycosyltransferase family 4 protein [Paenibacillus sp. N3.4]|uniref:glycosyltransferase family 4 protein n=1 Tax=Paenibacillus sp. N3.4 TaxID=2603222 RepID=UPI0011CCD4D2|nr:glycosyltransferase family 4 protein [Paenibacillus sp. N3.4]TXK85628.1 glycosyltransferase family 4 protein [Paenibacillus sp. N3.4]